MPKNHKVALQLRQETVIHLQVYHNSLQVANAAGQSQVHLTSIPLQLPHQIGVPSAISSPFCDLYVQHSKLLTELYGSSDNMLYYLTLFSLQYCQKLDNR